MADQELNNKEQDQELPAVGQDHENDRLNSQLIGNQKQSKIKRSVFRKIVNVFIGTFLGLILFTLIVLGYTQTKTFRETLREKVITLVNEEINGKLNIEKIRRYNFYITFSAKHVCCCR